MSILKQDMQFWLFNIWLNIATSFLNNQFLIVAKRHKLKKPAIS